jgi:uncharacterized membrane protein YhiD involved in acid resistance
MTARSAPIRRAARLAARVVVVLVALAVATPSAAQLPGADVPKYDHPVALDFASQLAPVKHAAVCLPIAAVLGAILAFRPRRRGTPPRTPPVIQTQIILALVGALVMLVVGSSLARAFGIVGAASLVRYRAKIDDPKDAGVMLSSLAIGLASGVSLYLLAVFATAVILGVLWLVESLEPQWHRTFNLKVATKDPAGLAPRIEDLLRRNQIRYELRTTSNDELVYEVALPYDRRTDRLSKTILGLDADNATAVEWEEKKPKKAST